MTSQAAAAGDLRPWNNLVKRSPVETKTEFPTSLEGGGSQ